MVRIAGAPGAGKSTVAWALSREPSPADRPIAYVDMDQLGMCYPAPATDPERWHLKDDALDAVADGYRSAGAQLLIVSGVADPVTPAPAHACAVWLEASATERRVRLAGRGWEDATVRDVVAAGTRESARAHRTWARVSTDGRTVAETVADVRALCVECPDSRPGPGPAPARSGAVPPLLWITGPRLAGASRIGWEIAAGDWRAGHRTGFLDARQLGFLGDGDARTGVANAVQVARVFARSGASAVVIVAPFDHDPEMVRAASPGAEVTVVRLGVTPSDLRANAESRRRGDGPRLAGDDLATATASDVAALIDAAIVEAGTPARSGEVLVPVSGLTVAEAAASVRTARALSRRR